jgi:hypothetical protein
MTMTEAVEAPPRPTRYFRFQVPHWKTLHDQVISEAAVRLLDMHLVIDRKAKPVEVFVGSSPNPFTVDGNVERKLAPFEVPRWQMLAVLLAEPELSGRWRPWLELAISLKAPLPHRIDMRVSTKDIFDMRVTTLAGVPDAVFFPLPVTSTAPPKPRTKTKSG